ncbi:MAG: HAD family hydrolase [Clostridia bacterium]|nr:HAD family hydrolase [Clostridia bacterium]
MSSRTVIFDLDDTLIRHDRVDETKRYAEYLKFGYTRSFHFEFYESLGGMKKAFKDIKITRKNVGEYFGETIPMLEKYHVSGHQMVDAIEECSIYIRDSNVDLALKCLKEANTRLYVLTDWFASQQLKVLKDFGYFDYFDKIFTWDSYYAKPDKRALLRCIQNENHDDFIMVGDSLEADILCAKMSCVSSVWFNPKRLDNKFGFRPEYTISSMLDLLDIVK